MADTPCDNSYKIVSIAHGAVFFYDPLGGGVDETVDFFEHRPATRISPATAINAYGYRATARFGLMATPVVRGTVTGLVFTLQQVDRAANNTVTCARAMAGAAGFSFDGQPHEQRQEFAYDAANTENFAPITVAVG